MKSRGSSITRGLLSWCIVRAGELDFVLDFVVLRKIVITPSCNGIWSNESILGACTFPQSSRRGWPAAWPRSHRNPSRLGARCGELPVKERRMYYLFGTGACMRGHQSDTPCARRWPGWLAGRPLVGRLVGARVARAEHKARIDISIGAGKRATDTLRHALLQKAPIPAAVREGCETNRTREGGRKKKWCDLPEIAWRWLESAIHGPSGTGTTTGYPKWRLNADAGWRIDCKRKREKERGERGCRENAEKTCGKCPPANYLARYLFCFNYADNKVTSNTQIMRNLLTQMHAKCNIFFCHFFNVSPFRQLASQYRVPKYVCNRHTSQVEASR